MRIIILFNLVFCLIHIKISEYCSISIESLIIQINLILKVRTLIFIVEFSFLLDKLFVLKLILLFSKLSDSNKREANFFHPKNYSRIHHK